LKHLSLASQELPECPLQLHLASGQCPVKVRDSDVLRESGFEFTATQGRRETIIDTSAERFHSRALVNATGEHHQLESVLFQPLFESPTLTKWVGPGKSEIEHG
jgi:hypothetical protein